MSIIICAAAKKKCYATMYSYGEICVGCGCCSPNTKIRRKARLKYWKFWLYENRHFNNWAPAEYPDMVALQKKNVSANIEHARKMVKVYSR